MRHQYRPLPATSSRTRMGSSTAVYIRSHLEHNDTARQQSSSRDRLCKTTTNRPQTANDYTKTPSQSASNHRNETGSREDTWGDTNLDGGRGSVNANGSQTLQRGRHLSLHQIAQRKVSLDPAVEAEREDDVGRVEQLATDAVDVTSSRSAALRSRASCNWRLLSCIIDGGPGLLDDLVDIELLRGGVDGNCAFISTHMCCTRARQWQMRVRERG